MLRIPRDPFGREPLRAFSALARVLVRTDWFLCVALVLWAGIRLLPGLDHPGLPRWDEGIHQAVARGVSVEPWRPHVFAHHIYPYLKTDWINGEVWLHKPPAPFWLGGLMLHFTGPTPMALRLVSVLADLVIALGLFFLLRRSIGRWLAALAGTAYLSLHFTWVLTQGFFFGDVTDTTLAACGVASTLALVRAVDRSSVRWALATGVLLGIGYLCKSALALAPAGVALVFVVLQGRRVARGLRPSSFMALAGSFVLVAVPWTLYSALSWPKEFRANAKLVRDHLTTDLYPWGRPIDALWGELCNYELYPIPAVLVLLAAVWIAWRAWSSRRALDIALAVWIWSSSIVLSLTPSKVPAHAFGVVPAVLAAIVILAADCRRRPVLAAASLAAMLSGVVTQALPVLSRVREVVPASLPETRGQPGLAEGLFLVALAAAGAELLRMLSTVPGRRGPRWPGLALGWATIVGCVILLGLATPLARQLDRQLYLGGMGATSYAREVGLALNHEVPENSVLFIGTSRNPECCSEAHSLIFYSGKMTYLRSPDPDTALAKGYAPFLISPMAEPYQPVPGVPAHAWWRAYDLRANRKEPAPLPEGLTPITGHIGVLDLMGIARGPAVRGRDRWVLVAHLRTATDHATATLAFKTRKGVVPVTVNVDNALVEAATLARAEWFVLPFLGPERADVIDLRAPDGTVLPLPPDT
jgi:4-amino-4-deoxy-L-arabinose transferase-like glycosyltransferase